MGGGLGLGMGRGGPMRSLIRDRSVVDTKVTKGTLTRILATLTPYRSRLAVFFALTVVDAAISVANPLLYREIIDRGVLGHDERIILVLAGVIAGLAVLDAALSLGEQLCSARVGQGLIYDLRTKVYAHIQRMPLAFFTRTQTGALVSRLNNDVLGAQQAMSDILSSQVGNLLGVAFVLTTMLLLSWQITLVALAILPAFAVPARFMGRKLGSITRESYVLAAEMNTTMAERFNVAGALLVKLFGRPGEEDLVFAARAGRVRDIAVVQAIYARVFFVSLTVTAALATALVYGWGGVLSLHGSLQVGTLVAMTAYLSRLYGPLTQLSNVNVDVMTALVSFDRVFEVLDLPPMITERRGALAVPPGPATIELDHVDFAYPSAGEVSLASLESVAVLEAIPSRQVLFDITFRAEPGQLVALVGPSGAGKTTITQLVARLYDPTGGAVRIDGHDLRDVTLDSLRRKVGMVTQDAHMFHETIRANLAYAKPGATEAELYEALEGAQILSLVESLPEGLDTLVGERGYRLSGGEKQRMAIARLLLKAPDVVVLDEATAHLDSESEVAVQQALKAALSGRTSLVIAHRLSTVRDADLILVVDEGRIVERGTHEELLADGGLYAELYRTQFRPQAIGTGGSGEALRSSRARSDALGPSPAAAASSQPGPGDDASPRPGPWRARG
ncbi:MAG TPA: ABC transporter ATP-binding protein, partial [Acidimicrobiales bacterium]|nr:ABC transporter ATP-binding protein [Acidimicrobiales bacterium]